VLPVPRDLLPARWRDTVLLAALACWGLAAGLGTMYHGARWPGPLDRSAHRIVHNIVAPNPVLAFVLAAPTRIPVIASLFTLLLVATVTTRRWIWVALTVLGPALAIALTELVVKPLTDRGRGGHLLYPSGHMTAIVAVITVTYILLTTGKPARYHVLTGLTWLAAIIVAATGLIGNREHFFTDTLGGMLVAIGAVLVTATALDAVGNRGRTMH
jgi:hypothetical protein